MTQVEILDCTLRESGYLNNRNFGVQNIQSIVNNLENSNIKYIECGYLKDVKFNPDIALYNSIKTFENFIGQHKAKLILMINYGEYFVEETPQNTLLRIAFRKNDRENALKYCKELKEKGFEIFINPMHTNFYTEYELENLINSVNKICPYGFTVTDSTGSMTEADLSNIFKITENLDKNIKLCFHSHNNLQLSFSNARHFIRHNENIIIDSTLCGVGRGGGNLSTEKIAEFLNNSFDKNYNMSTILKTAQDKIQPICKEKLPQIPYFISAVNKCHPNYAKFLIEKSIPYEKFNEILKNIPPENKPVYDEKLINKIMVRFLEL